MASKFVVLRRYPALIHAQLAKSALAAYEIQAAIQIDPYPGATETFNIVVESRDVAVALEILGGEEAFSD